MKQIFRDDGVPIIIDNNIQKSNGKYMNRFNSNQIEKEGLFIPDMNHSLTDQSRQINYPRNLSTLDI